MRQLNGRRVLLKSINRLLLEDMNTALFVSSLAGVSCSLEDAGFFKEARQLDSIILKICGLGQASNSTLDEDEKWKIVDACLLSFGSFKVGPHSYSAHAILSFNKKLSEEAFKSKSATITVTLQELADSASAVDAEKESILFFNSVVDGKIIATQCLKLHDGDFEGLQPIVRQNGTLEALSDRVAEKLIGKDRLVASNPNKDESMPYNTKKILVDNKVALTDEKPEIRRDAYHKLLHNMYYADISSEKAYKLRLKAADLWQKSISTKDGPERNQLRESAIRLTHDSFAQEHNDKNELADKCASKQISAHTFFTNLLGQDLDEGATVVSPGAGLGHENMIGEKKFSWISMDFQGSIINLARERDRLLGINTNKYMQWSVWNGELSDANRPINEEQLEKSLGSVPPSQAMYCKHACGGITDGSLKRAVENGVKKIVIASCCADRLSGISHAVLCPEMPFEDYMSIVRRSQVRNSSDGHDAVMQIDDLRESYLIKHGYSVERGWKTDDKTGARLPAGSYLVATKRE